MENNLNITAIQNSGTRTTADEDIIDAELIIMNGSSNLQLTDNLDSNLELLHKVNSPMALFKNQQDCLNTISVLKSNKKEYSDALFQKKFLEDDKDLGAIVHSYLDKHPKADFENILEELVQIQRDDCKHLVEKDDTYLKYTHIINSLEEVVKLFALTHYPEKLNEILQPNNSFISGNFINPKSLEEREIGISNCETDVKKKKLIHYQDMLKIIEIGISAYKFNNKYFFKANHKSEYKIVTSLRAIEEKFREVLMDEEFFNRIKSIINIKFIIAIQESGLFPEHHMEFFYNNKTYLVTRNTYVQINKCDLNMIRKECPLILAYFLEFCKNDKVSFTAFLFHLAYMIQNVEAPDITLILYGKHGKGVSFLFDIILAPLFIASQSVYIGKEEFKNLDETCSQNILCYIGSDLHTLSDNEDEIEVKIDKFLTEPNDFNINIINTETVGYIDILNDLDGITILEVDNSQTNFTSLSGKPKKVLKKLFGGEIEPLRNHLFGFDLSAYDANVALNNPIKNALKEPPTPLINFVNHVKLGDLNYFKEALKSKDPKILKAYSEVEHHLSITSKNKERCFPKGALHILFCYLENVKMGKSLFFKKLVEIDNRFFSEENMTKRSGFVYKLDTEYNDRYSTSLATVQ